jgi:hypothetical protein
MATTDVEEAKWLFRKAELGFPQIPDELEALLKKQSKWWFSTRQTDVSPYSLQDYVCEFGQKHVEDYALLCHHGHGANSYAIHYYLVRSTEHGRLAMFLQLAWGGIYMDNDAEAAKIRQCFALADRVVQAALTSDRLQPDECFTIVVSDLYGSYMAPPGVTCPQRYSDYVHHVRPQIALSQAICWLTGTVLRSTYDNKYMDDDDNNNER